MTEHNKHTESITDSGLYVRMTVMVVDRFGVQQEVCRDVVLSGFPAHRTHRPESHLRFRVLQERALNDLPVRVRSGANSTEPKSCKIEYSISKISDSAALARARSACFEWQAVDKHFMLSTNVGDTDTCISLIYVGKSINQSINQSIRIF